MAEPRRLLWQETAGGEPRRSPRKQQKKLRTIKYVEENRRLPADVPPGPWPSIEAATRALESHYSMENMKAQPSQAKEAANRGTWQPICCMNESRGRSTGCRFHVVIEEVEKGSEKVWAPWRANLTHADGCSFVSVDEQVAGLLQSPNPDRERLDEADAQALQEISAQRSLHRSQLEEMVERRRHEQRNEGAAAFSTLLQAVQGVDVRVQGATADVYRGASASRPTETTETTEGGHSRGLPSIGRDRRPTQPETIDITGSPDALDGLSHQLGSLGLRTEPPSPRAGVAPKPARSGYDVFCRVCRAERPALRGLKVGQQSQALGAGWKALTERERAPYNEQARRVMHPCDATCSAPCSAPRSAPCSAPYDSQAQREKQLGVRGSQPPPVAEAGTRHTPTRQHPEQRATVAARPHTPVLPASGAGTRVGTGAGTGVGTGAGTRVGTPRPDDGPELLVFACQPRDVPLPALSLEAARLTDCDNVGKVVLF